MNFEIIMLFEALLIAFAISIDAFVSGFAYGSNKIKIPFVSVKVISIVCSSILGLSFLAGSVIRNYIPEWLTIAICFGILFVLGIIKLLDSVTKSIIRKYADLKKELKFSLFHFKFILNLYADPEKADIDSSRIISPAEAFSLAIALSLDGIAVGFGAALSRTNGLLIFLSSLIITALAIMVGCFIGNKIAKKLRFNISWLSGVLFLILAFSQFL